MKNPAVHTEQVPPLPLTESPALQDQGILLRLLRNRHFAVLLPPEARGLQSPTSMPRWLALDLPEQDTEQEMQGGGAKNKESHGATQATETKVTYSRENGEAERPWQRQEAPASPGLQLLLER